MAEERGGWKRPFLTVWTGQQFSLVGSQLVQFALVWWLTQKTGSATVLATATMVAILPQVLIGPLAGALIDRWSRRRVMIVADGAIALVSAWLAYLFFAGSVEVWHIFVVAAARAVGGGFHFPAMAASTTLMVPREHLARVAGLNQATRGVTGIVAPPLGALLLSFLPMYGILGIDVLTAAVAIVPLLFIPIPQPEPISSSTSGRPSVLREMREGFRYVLAWPGLLLVLVMAMLINFVANPAGALLPLFVTKHLHGDALGLGWLNSSLGVGVVLGGLALGVWGGFRRRIVTTLLGVVGMGLGFLVVGLAPEGGLWIAMGGLFFAGTMNAMANGPLSALLQSQVAPGMQGRVFTLVQSLVTAMSPLSLALAGPLADLFGIRFLYVVSAAVMVLMGAGALLVRPILHLEDDRAPEPTPAGEVAPVSARPVD